MADDEPLLLNLATDGPDASPTPRRKAFKRDKKGNRSNRKTQNIPAGGRTHGLGRQTQTGAPGKPGRASSSLKGYALDDVDSTPTGAAQTGKSPNQRPPGGSKGGRLPPSTIARPPKIHESSKSGEVPENKTAGDAEPEEAFSPQDLLHAVALSMRKDENMAAEGGEGLPASGSDEETEAGVVSFMDERFEHKPVSKRRRQAEAPAEKPPKRRKGLGLVHPKSGELVHASLDVPEELRAVVFGTAAASSFQQLGLATSLSSHLQGTGFKAPTRIQQQCIPILLAGRDALVSAPTGSGKTLAYLAPIVNDLQGEEPRLNRGDGTFAIVLAPTRELCLQINDVLSTLLKRYHWLVGGLITGGENRAKEKARLRKGVTVLVATPGRLLDHLSSTSAFHTEELRWLVLDEADRLLDLGFEKKISEIVQVLDERNDGTKRRQSVLLSATMHSKLDSLVSLSLKDPISIGFTSSDGLVDGNAQLNATPAGEFSIPEQLVQSYIQVGGRQRLAALVAVLRRASRPGTPCKLVVFMSSCDGVEFHHRLLKEALPRACGQDLLGCPCFKLHGNLPQSQRTQAFLEFSKCVRGILLCTDVAARGLDFPAVTSIVQYDPPGEATEYVHRVGRTARMGQKGEAVLFLLPSEMGYLDMLHSAGCNIRELSLEEALQALPSRGLASAKGQPFPGEVPAAYQLHSQAASAVAADPGLRSLAGDAFRSFVRAYATHPASLRDVFHVRRLHLGHVAHSFALKEAPSLLGKSASKAAAKKAKAESKAKKPKLRR